MKISLIILFLMILYVVYKYSIYFFVKSKNSSYLQYKDHNYWVITSTEDYDVDKDFYSKSNSDLTLLGFVKLADLATSITNKTYISTYKNPESAIIVSLYSLKTDQNHDYAYINNFDFESETVDGEFYVTTNAWTSRHIKLPTTIHMTYLEEYNGIDSIYQIQISKIKDKNILSVNTIDEVIASQNRMNEIKSQFRESLGGSITISEIKEIDKNMHSDVEKIKQSRSLE